MLVDRKNLRMHLFWIIIFVVGTAASIFYYYHEYQQNERTPGGSGEVGIVLGVLGGAIILFEFMLWPRRFRKVRAWRIGKAQAWMRAHIWLGLLTIPLIWLHSDFNWGGQLSTILAWLYIIVIGSGVFGLVAQNVIPKNLLANVPAETIFSQIEYVSEELATDAEKLVLAVCGPAPDDSDFQPTEAVATSASAMRPGLVVQGFQRPVGNAFGRDLRFQLSADLAGTQINNPEALRNMFYTTIRPFLSEGAKSTSPLRYRDRSLELFRELRARLSEEAFPVVDAMESWCEHRRQFDRQARMHRMLHGWLAIHLPLSMALVILMFVHIFVALKYW
ncbi:MAG: hypothetical protein CMJ78_06110 [Planctomycetaceae bacterium]|nr:hypothetical protein [Planctomycetaceae bacterium]